MPKTKLISEDTITEEVTQEKVVEKVAAKAKKKFEQSDGVVCRSVVQGALFFEGIKTGMLYSFADYGDETEIEYRDLVAAVRSKDKAVFEPRFIVEDEDFIAEFPALSKYYSEQFTIKDIKAILNMSEGQMTEAIKKLPKGAFDSLKSMAAQQVANGTLDSVRKIKALDKLFGTDLNLLSEILLDTM